MTISPGFLKSLAIYTGVVLFPFVLFWRVPAVRGPRGLIPMLVSTLVTIVIDVLVVNTWVLP